MDLFLFFFFFIRFWRRKTNEIKRERNDRRRSRRRRRNPCLKTEKGTRTQTHSRAHTVVRKKKVNIKLKRSFKSCTRRSTTRYWGIWSTPVFLLAFCFVWYVSRICVPLKAINLRFKHTLCLHIYGVVKILRKNCSYHITMHHHTHQCTPVDKTISSVVAWTEGMEKEMTENIKPVKIHNNHISFKKKEKNKKITYRKFIWHKLVLKWKGKKKMLTPQFRAQHPNAFEFTARIYH